MRVYACSRHELPHCDLLMQPYIKEFGSHNIRLCQVCSPLSKWQSIRIGLSNDGLSHVRRQAVTCPIVDELYIWLQGINAKR